MENRKVFTFSLPKSVLEDVKRIACEAKLTRSELFRMAITDLIGRLKWEKASRFGQKAAREMKITEEDIEGIVHDFRKKRS